MRCCELLWIKFIGPSQSFRLKIPYFWSLIKVIHNQILAIVLKYKMSQDDDDWNTQQVSQPVKRRGDPQPVVQPPPNVDNSWDAEGQPSQPTEPKPSTEEAPKNSRGSEGVMIGSSKQQVKEEVKEEVKEDKEQKQDKDEKASNKSSDWLGDEPSEVKKEEKKEEGKSEGRGQRRGEGRGEGRGEEREEGGGRGEGRGEGRGRGEDGGRGQGRGEGRGQGRGEGRGEDRGYGQRRNFGNRNYGDNQDRRGDGFRGRGRGGGGRGGFNRDRQGGGFNRDREGGGGYNRFNRNNEDGENGGGRRFGGGDRDNEGRGEGRRRFDNNGQNGQNHFRNNRRDEDRPRYNNRGDQNNDGRPRNSDDKDNNKPKPRADGWIISPTTPLSGFFRPELSISLNRTKISVVMQNLFNIKKDMLILVFNDEKLDIPPGAAIANAEPRVRGQLEKKRDKWQKADPEVFNVVTQQLKNFEGIIMVKLETIEKSLRKALDEFLSISDKNFTSVAIPFLGKNDENVEKTAKEMIDVIVNFFEKHKKLTTRIQDLTICVKEKEEFLSLEKFFWQRIQDYIDRNMIWSE